MENASKALIIAGAILISILLISVGIIVMNAINDPVAQAGSSAESQAIEIFNAKFTSYIGSELDYNTVRSLLTTITSVNGTSDVQNDKTNREVTFKSGSITSVTGLNRSKTYDVEITDEKGNSDGYYDTVNIKEHTN